MLNIEILISAFKKELGISKDENVLKSVSDGVYSLTFLHSSKIEVKILLFEFESNKFVIHHELSKENPIISRKIVRACERMQTIMEGKNTLLLLSDDIAQLQKEAFIKTAIKSMLQNFLMKHFVLFKTK